MQSKHHSRASRRKGERGNVLAYTVLSALFLFLAVGLGVDLSHFYLAKTEMQNAADAAALAGASALTLPNPDRITTAVNRAVNLLNTNKYNFNNQSFSVDRAKLCGPGEACVTFAENLDQTTYVSEAAAIADPDNIRFIKVTTPAKAVSVIFASPLLGSALSLNAKATAGLSVPGNVRVCVAPLSAVAPNPGESFPAGSEGTCKTAGIQKYTDGTPDCDPTKEFCKGCLYTIRAGTTTNPSPGNYQILACAGNGGAQVRDALAAYGAGCKCGNISPGDEIGVDTKTKPGDTAGPVQDGLNVRFDDYKGAVKYSESTPPDLNVAQGITYTQYTEKSPFVKPENGHMGQPDRRVLKIPIIEDREFDNGKDVVHVKSLTGFFMQEPVGKKKNGDITVEYVGGDVNGVTGLDPSGGSTTNIVTPVLYR